MAPPACKGWRRTKDRLRFVPVMAQGDRKLLPGMELMSCPNLAVPNDVMQHVVRVESSFNPYAIGVVGGRLARQPRNLSEALATARMLEARGFNFSVGLAQVNRHNFDRYGLDSYERAFDACPNLQAGARILAECHGRSGGDWGKSFSCYYSGNFTTGFRHGYVQKIYSSMRGAGGGDATPVEVVGGAPRSRSSSAPESSGRPGSWRQRADVAVSRATPATAVPVLPVVGAVTAGPASTAVVLQPTSPPPPASPKPIGSEPGDQAFVF